MASKGAPKAAAATNSTQLRKAPVSLRSAMRKYAEGGDVTSTVPDYSRAYGALGGAEGVNALRNQLLGMGISEDIIGSSLSKYYTPEPQQGMSPEATRPTPPPPPETNPIPPTPDRQYNFSTGPTEERYAPPTPDITEPRFPERERPPERPDIRPEIYPQDYAGIRTTGSTQQPQGPQTSYRMNADGSRTEIGYDGQPIANYTPEQLAMHLATTGVTPPEYRYVWNGEGYDKLPNGPQTGYGPTPEMETKRPPPPEESRYEPRYPEKERPPEQPRYEEPVAPQMPYYPEEPMPETYIEPEVNFPEDPGFYQPPVDYTPTRPVDYYNPSPPMDFTQDPGILQPTEPVYNPASKRGGDLAKLLADLIARKGGGGSLEEQRRLMELLGSIRG